MTSYNHHETVKESIIFRYTHTDENKGDETLGRFTFWISLSLRPKTDQTAQLWSQTGVEINQSLQCTSLHKLTP